MRIKIKPFIVEGRLDAQHVKIRVGSHEVARLKLTESQFGIHEIQIPPDYLSPEELTVITFELPDARSHTSMRTGKDARDLALAFASLQFDLTP